MEPKKISFGFSKINKKLNLTTNKDAFKNETKVELIKCLEGQEIKLVEEKPEEQPLIIPLKEAQKTSAAIASLIKRRAVLLGEDEPIQATLEGNIKTAEDPAPDLSKEPEDIDKRAARELLAELQANGSSDVTSTLVLPVVKPDDLPLEGAKESSLDDYESIPIQDFGKAMLRGMGWSEPPKVATKGGPPIEETPMVRPKGMGLGADKALKKQPLLVAPESNEVLEIKRNAYVRILGGKHKDLYGQIEGFDDHAGRVIVKMAIGGFKEAFNEFLCQPVSRKEFAQYGKCINSTKYDEYKKKENEFGQIILKKDELDELADKSKDNRKIKKERRYSSDEAGNDKKYQKEGKTVFENDAEMEEIKKEEKDYSRDKKEKFECKKELIKDNERDCKRDYGRDDNRKDAKDRSRDRYDERQKNRNDDRDHKREKYRDDERDRKRENQGDLKDHKRDNYHTDSRDRKKESYKNDERESRREKERDAEREHKRNKEREEDKYRNEERNKYNVKYDKNQKTESYKDTKETSRDSRRDLERDSHRDNRDRGYSNDSRDNQKYRDRNQYAERNTKRNDKVIQIDESSDSENDSPASKPKKSSKHHKKSKKKSKKSKKGKSKHKNDTSDSEISSASSEDSDSSSDSEEEKRKKHKKKTKKSKKQRERSRSREKR